MWRSSSVSVTSEVSDLERCCPADGVLICHRSLHLLEMVERTSQGVSTPNLTRPLELWRRVCCWAPRLRPRFHSQFWHAFYSNGLTIQRLNGGIFTERILTDMIYDSPHCISGAHSKMIEGLASGILRADEVRDEILVHFFQLLIQR
jgi:hypothetical protein